MQSNKNYNKIKIVDNDTYKLFYSAGNISNEKADSFVEFWKNNSCLDNDVYQPKGKVFNNLYSTDYIKYFPKTQSISYFSNTYRSFSEKLEEKLENVTYYDNLDQVELFIADFNYKSVNNADYFKHSEFKIKPYWKAYNINNYHQYRQSQGEQQNYTDQVLYYKKKSGSKLYTIYFEQALLNKFSTVQKEIPFKIERIKHIIPKSPVIMSDGVLMEVSLHQSFLVGERYCYNRPTFIVKLQIDFNEYAENYKKDDFDPSAYIEVQILSALDKISIYPFLNAARNQEYVYWLESDWFNGHCKSFEIVKLDTNTLNKETIHDYVYPYQFDGNNCDQRKYLKNTNKMMFLRHTGFYQELVIVDLDKNQQDSTTVLHTEDNNILSFDSSEDHIVILCRNINRQYLVYKFDLKCLNNPEKVTVQISQDSYKTYKYKLNDYNEAIFVYDSKKPFAALKGIFVSIHGGPNVGNVLDYSLYTKTLLDSGYGVLKLNYEGSLGYGKNNSERLSGKIGVLDVENCFKMINQLFEQEALVDLGIELLANKIHVGGGSHGGFMSSFLVGKYHNQFKSAIIEFPACDLIWMYSATDIPDWVMGQALDQKWDQYRDLTQEELTRLYLQSPMSVASNIRVPCLITAGKLDLRTPWQQARKLWNIISDNGVDTQFLLYQEEPHGQTKQNNVVDAIINNLVWLDMHKD